MEPESIIRRVVDSCADCDVCRHLMDSNCFFFPRVYELYDREQEGGERVRPEELRELTDLCNFCALCPCPNVREDIIRAKTAFVRRDGLAFGIRVLEDVGRMGRLCGAFPRVSGILLGNRRSRALVRGLLGIHPERKLPVFPRESFPAWLKKHPPRLPLKKGKRKVAYFAGCTGNYLFPQVPRAVVEVLRHNGIEVRHPEPRCCGMPSMLEGNRELTLRFARSNMEELAELANEGYDIVCSCPTCGYMLKTVLREGAYYSPEYQDMVGGDDKYLKIPESTSRSGEGGGFVRLGKAMYREILKDEGYFSGIAPLKRVAVAENTYDLGEYLGILRKAGELETDFSAVSGYTVYYPPCHLREQRIGMPYLDLLKLVPDISLRAVGGNFHCCGISGIMGFKREFHEASLGMGHGLAEKIREMNPERIVTDCLSCKLQFGQMMSRPVAHPIEILNESYQR